VLCFNVHVIFGITDWNVVCLCSALNKRKLRKNCDNVNLDMRACWKNYKLKEHLQIGTEWKAWDKITYI
jgi:hypothetical protein